MADYIDKQKALAAIEAEREYMTRRQEWLADHILTHCGYRIIEGMPSADVEPVRHAKPNICDHRDGSFSFVCSGCKANIDPNDNYCRKCGAILKER